LTVRVYLDSCVVIYLVEKCEPWWSRIQSLLLPPNGPLPEVVYSDLTRMECRIGPMSRANSVALAEYDRFFATPHYQKLPISTAVFDLAADLRAQHRIKTPDALHLATAIQAGCSEFWSNDQRLATATGHRIRLIAP
jgi:predicted nucleic acid-binding protein